MEIPEPIQSTPPIMPPTKSWSVKSIGLIVGLVIVAAAAVAVLGFWQKKPVTPTTKDNNGKQSQTSATDVQWRGDGVALSDLKLIKNYQDDLNPTINYSTDPVKYYDMGTRVGNKVILAVAPAVDPSGESIFFFEQSAGGYRFMAQASDDAVYTKEKQQGYVFSTALLPEDTTTVYNDVIGPKEFTYRGLSLKQLYPYPSDLFSKAITEEQSNSVTVSFNKLDTVSDGDLYVEQLLQTEPNQVNFNINWFYLRLRSGLYNVYTIKYPFFTDDSVAHITWNDGSANKDSYGNLHITGCGAPSAYITSLRDISNDVQVAGMTSTGEKIYELKNIHDPIMQFVHDLAGKIYDQATASYRDVSIEEMAAHHAVIFYKDALGNYEIFNNDKYGPQAECGKPVIYLYPTKPTNVRVQVGAEITKSDPVYDNGWQVQASPNGQLVMNGKTYDSLFWEGTGFGPYPNVTAGTIVPQDQVEMTIRAQLSQLGLSSKEAADFMDFWLPKMPTTPYVRLTWFNAKQMNELAPLVVWPHPDTTIRLFLDFEGLQQPIALPAQHLTAIPRTGFTLVEWGGILRK